jgi:hypothetical protein
MIQYLVFVRDSDESLDAIEADEPLSNEQIEQLEKEQSEKHGCEVDIWKDVWNERMSGK